MVTRRTLLLTVGVAAVTAGCSTPRSESSPRVLCETGSTAGEDNPVFSVPPGVSADGTDELLLAELTLPIRKPTIESQSVDRLVVFSGDEVQYQIPVNANDEAIGETNRYEYDDVVEYSQSLGHLPQNGVFRVTALAGDGQQLDEVIVEFRCYQQTEAPTTQ